MEADSEPYFEGCGLWAKCENRGQRAQLQWRLYRLDGGFGCGFSVAGVADPGAARCVKAKPDSTVAARASPNVSPNVFLSGSIPFCPNVDLCPILCPRREVQVEKGVKLPSRALIRLRRLAALKGPRLPVQGATLGKIFRGLMKKVVPGAEVMAGYGRVECCRTASMLSAAASRRPSPR